MSALAIGSLEVLRFFRRRSTAWIFILTISLVATAYLVSWFRLSGMFQLNPGPEVINRILMVIQTVGLCAAAWMMAKRSVANEVETGSFTLLTQTPILGSRIVLGKLLGLAAILLVAHCLIAMVVMLPTPMIRRPIWVFYVYLVVGWLLAVSIVPAGLADGLASRTGGRRWLRHLSWVLRVIGPVVILQGLILQESRVAGIRIWDVAMQFVGNVVGNVSSPATLHFARPAVPIAVITLWFAALAVVDWYRAVGRLGRSRG
jgi:hypothetical protein